MAAKKKTAREREFAKLSKAEKKEFLRRSKAAKKGHAKRRKEKRAKSLAQEVRKNQRLVANARIVVGKKPKKKVDRRTKAGKKKAGIAPGESATQRLERLEQELALARSDLEALQETAHFVPTRAPEYLHSDGTLAQFRSRLRHIEEAPNIRSALEKIGDPDAYEFDILANEIAEFYDVEVQEVYTLWFSP